MTSSRLVRGAKTRTIGCICLVLLLGALVYLFQGTQSKLADVQKVANKCSQQADTLSAQLNVLFDYKVKLEKSLQNEKMEKAKLVEEHKKELESEKEIRESEKNEFNRKINSFHQEKIQLQIKMSDMKELYERQISDLNLENNDLKQSFKTVKEDLDKLQLERDELNESVVSLKEEVKRNKFGNTSKENNSIPNNKVDKLETDKKQLEDRLDKAQKEIAGLKSISDKESPGPEVGESNLLKPDDNKHALEPPMFNEENAGDVRGSKGKLATTPRINPQALYTSDPTTKKSSKQQNHENKPDPIAQPASNNAPGRGFGVIPGPPDDMPPVPMAASPNKPSNLDGNQGNNIINDNNAAIEELADAPLPDLF